MPLPPTITDGSVTLTFGAAGVYYGYCTIADVQYEFPNQESLVTTTNSAIAQEITFAASEIQDALARFYQMPYVGTDGGVLLTLRDLNAKLAVANLCARFYTGGSPDLSGEGEARRGWVEAVLTDIKDGVIQWGPGFADAVPMAEKPSYPLSSGATVYPNPNIDDPYAATPMFAMGQNRYKFRGGGLI